MSYETTLYYNMITKDDQEPEFGWYRNITKPLAEDEIKNETAALNMSIKANSTYIKNRKDVKIKLTRLGRKK